MWQIVNSSKWKSGVHIYSSPKHTTAIYIHMSVSSLRT